MILTPPAGRVAVALVDHASWIEVFEAQTGFRVEHHSKKWGGQSYAYVADIVYDTDVPRAIGVLLAGREQEQIADVTGRITERMGGG